jgi:hypothetical protein
VRLFRTMFILILASVYMVMLHVRSFVEWICVLVKVCKEFEQARFIANLHKHTTREESEFRANALPSCRAEFRIHGRGNSASMRNCWHKYFKSKARFLKLHLQIHNTAKTRLCDSTVLPVGRNKQFRGSLRRLLVIVVRISNIHCAVCGPCFHCAVVARGPNFEGSLCAPLAFIHRCPVTARTVARPLTCCCPLSGRPGCPR